LAVIVWLLLISPALAQQSPAPNEDSREDTQIWPDTQISVRLRPSQFRLTLFGTARIGRNSAAVISKQVGAGLSRNFGNYLAGAFFYRYLASEPTPNRQLTEHRFWLDLTARIPIGADFTLVDRNRAEYREINHRVSGRYRNRLQIEKSINIGEHWEITPYIAGEGFYDGRSHQWSRFQYLFGSRLPANKYLSFDIYYMRTLDTQARPGFLNVFGVTTRVDL
jgi:hypothetical protein